jgi:uncharacterized protein YcfJ
MMNVTHTARIAVILSFFATGAVLAGEGNVIHATVLSADPVMETVVERIPREYCRDERVRVIEQRTPRLGATLTGAVLGGVLGNTVGRHSSHRGAIAGVSAVAGAAVAREYSERRRPADVYTVTEEVCEVEYDRREVERMRGYRVRYQVGDSIYETMRASDPGSTLPVRIHITPLP